jgi:hypothetical protein
MAKKAYLLLIKLKVEFNLNFLSYKLNKSDKIYHFCKLNATKYLIKIIIS